MSQAIYNRKAPNYPTYNLFAIHLYIVGQQEKKSVGEKIRLLQETKTQGLRNSENVPLFSFLCFMLCLARMLPSTEIMLINK